MTDWQIEFVGGPKDGECLMHYEVPAVLDFVYYKPILQWVYDDEEIEIGGDDLAFTEQYERHSVIGDRALYRYVKPT